MARAGRQQHWRRERQQRAALPFGKAIVPPPMLPIDPLRPIGCRILPQRCEAAPDAAGASCAKPEQQAGPLSMPKNLTAYMELHIPSFPRFEGSSQHCWQPAWHACTLGARRVYPYRINSLPSPWNKITPSIDCPQSPRCAVLTLRNFIPVGFAPQAGAAFVSLPRLYSKSFLHCDAAFGAPGTSHKRGIWPSNPNPRRVWPPTPLVVHRQAPRDRRHVGRCSDALHWTHGWQLREPCRRCRRGLALAGDEVQCWCRLLLSHHLLASDACLSSCFWAPAAVENNSSNSY